MLAAEKDMLKQVMEKIVYHLQMIYVHKVYVQMVHKEQHLYYNGWQQLSSLSNVHYHANMECPKVWFANFCTFCSLVPNDLKHKFTIGRTQSIFVSNF